MRLVDAQEADRLYGAMGPAIEISGGSAANTIAGLASFGGKGAFIGKRRRRPVRQGLLARHPRLGVAFETAPAASGQPTAAASFS